MNKHTSYYVIFMEPGTFVSESWKRDVDGPDPRAVKWPDNAYAFTLFKREDVTVDGKVYQGEPEQIGKLYYHPDSVIQTYEEAQANPKATRILLTNMRINRWPQIIWTRWGNWPQHYEPESMEVLS